MLEVEVGSAFQHFNILSLISCRNRDMRIQQTVVKVEELIFYFGHGVNNLPKRPYLYYSKYAN
jgi:hypothetical protein